MQAVKPILRMGVALAALVLATLVLATTASAQAWPAKPIRLIAMGAGFPENTARIVGAEIAEMTKQPVIIETKAGANGILAAQYVAQAPGDGYTILVGTNSTHAANQSLYKKLPYDYVKDFVPVSGISKGILMAVVHPSVPAKNIAELTAMAKKDPDKLTYGSASTSSRAAVELYKMLSGAKILHVPYKTTPQAATDLIGGRIDLLIINLGEAVPQVNAGKLRALAVSSTQRWPGQPEVPTMQEAGVAGYDWSFWLAAWMPESTPRDVVSRANELFVAALNRPKVKEYLTNAGSIPFPTTSDQLMRFQITEHDKWKKVIAAAGIQPE